MGWVISEAGKFLGGAGAASVIVRSLLRAVTGHSAGKGIVFTGGVYTLPLTCDVMGVLSTPFPVSWLSEFQL